MWASMHAHMDTELRAWWILAAISQHIVTVHQQFFSSPEALAHIAASLIVPSSLIVIDVSTCVSMCEFFTTFRCASRRILAHGASCRLGDGFGPG